MSKKTAKSHSTQTTLRLETLETRQLLATIVMGAGSEVDSNVTLPNGNTYDQILLSGSTITVTADAGQVTRVDFLDLDGDIIRAEFAGAGQLAISLTDFKEAAKPANYATETKYVQGLAGFRISGSNASTNFTLYSLGSANVNGGAGNPIFAGGTKHGGNNFANAAHVLIEGSGLSSQDFGGLRAGNAVFGAASGFVGIGAADIRFSGPIVIGGLVPAGNAGGVLQISADSPNGTLVLAGTDLAQGPIINSGLGKVIATAGQSSMGVSRPVVEFTPGRSFTNPSEITSIEYVPSAETLTLSGDTSAEQLASYAKTYFNDVVVKEDFTGTFSAKMIRNVIVEGDLGAIIQSGSSIGEVRIAGGIIEGGALEARTGISSVTVEGAIDFSGSGYDTVVAGVITTTRGDIGSVVFKDAVNVANGDVPLILAGGGIGMITGESLSQNLASVRVFQAKGDIGTISFGGRIDIQGTVAVGGNLGSLTGAEVILGDVDVNGAIGSLASTTGDLSLGQVSAEAAVGELKAAGNLVIDGLVSETADIGDLVAGRALRIEGAISAAAGSIGRITAGKGGLTVNDDVTTAGAIGDISVTGSDSDLVFGANGAFKAGTDLGNVTVAKGGIVSANSATAEFSAVHIGNVTVTGHSSTSVLLNDVVFVAEGVGASVGNVSLDASANSAGAVAASDGLATTGVAGTGFSSSGRIGDITIVGHEDGRLLVNSGDVLLFRAGNSNMGATTPDIDAEANDISIGDVNIQANLSGLSSGPGTGLIVASGVKITTAGKFVSGTDSSVVSPEKAASGSIGSLSIVDFGGASVVGFNRSALASTAVFAGGSVIVADSIGAMDIEAGDTVTAPATGTSRKGALDTDGNGEFEGNGDLYVIVL